MYRASILSFEEAYLLQADPAYKIKNDFRKVKFAEHSRPVLNKVAGWLHLFKHRYLLTAANQRRAPTYEVRFVSIVFVQYWSWDDG